MQRQNSPSEPEGEFCATTRITTINSGDESRLNFIRCDDDDSTFGADVFAQATTDASARIGQLGQPVKLVTRQRQTVKGANIDTKVATGTAVRIDDRFRPVGPPRNAVTQRTVLVFDAVFRTYVRAGVTVDANFPVDDVQLPPLT